MFMRIIALSALAIAFAGCASPGQNEVQAGHERSACAEMGLDPGSQAFAACVGNLDAAEFTYMSSAYR